MCSHFVYLTAPQIIEVLYSVCSSLLLQKLHDPTLTISEAHTHTHKIVIEDCQNTVVMTSLVKLFDVDPHTFYYGSHIYFHDDSHQQFLRKYSR